MRHAIAVLLMILAACGGPRDAAAGSERAVCDTFQRMVDELRTGSSQRAVAEMRELERLAASSGNQVISRNGMQFSTALNKQVGDSEVGASEALAEGRLALETGGGALSRIYRECNRVGQTVDLPDYDREGRRIPGS